MRRSLRALIFVVVTSLSLVPAARAETTYKKFTSALGEAVMDALMMKAQTKAASKELKGECDKGNGEACSIRGYIYEVGYGGMRKNRKTASDLYRKGCDLDDGLGCARLARMYYEGDYVDYDHEKGLRLFRKACKLGRGDICDWLHGWGEGPVREQAHETY